MIKLIKYIGPGQSNQHTGIIIYWLPYLPLATAKAGVAEKSQTATAAVQENRSKLLVVAD